MLFKILASDGFVCDECQKSGSLIGIGFAVKDCEKLSVSPMAVGNISVNQSADVGFCFCGDIFCEKVEVMAGHSLPKFGVKLKIWEPCIGYNIM